MNTIRERRPGETPTIDCRHDAHEIVDKKRRQKQIVACLREIGPATAKEIAVHMMKKGLAMTDDRNVSAPRLTELGREGIVEPVGTKVCQYTGRTVTVWGLCNG